MVTRADIESKAREIEDTVRTTEETVKASVTWLAVGVVLLAAIAFFLGRRKGKAGGAVVEVYRIK